MDAERGPKLNLKPCKNCGRTFVPESLVKHQKICKDVQKKRKPFDMTQQRATEDLSVGQIKKAQKKVKHEKSCKTVQKKRKPFDPAKQRVTEDLSLKQIKAAQKKTVAPPKSHWRATHNEFISNIRAAKGAQHAAEMGLPLPPPPPPAANLDYVECPYCQRRFNEKAAERHISFCKEQTKRVGNKRQPNADELRRAAASKGFQAPKPKGRGDAQSMSSRGGYSNSPPAGRGGYSSSPSAARGGYSSSPGVRGAPEASRAPGSGGMGGGSSSRGRAPAGPTTRGRPSPSQPSYGAILYTGNEFNNNSYEVMVHDSFSPTKTGPRLRSDRSSMTSDPASSSKVFTDKKTVAKSTEKKRIRDDMPDSQQKIPPKIVLHGRRTMTESGYSSSNSDLDIFSSPNISNHAVPSMKVTPTLDPSPSSSKFCHECGSKFLVPSAKFCCECGIRRLTH